MTSSVSFGFSKLISKSKVKEEVRLKFSADAKLENQGETHSDSDGERTERISGSGDLLKRKPDKSEQNLVIPLIKENEWRFKKESEEVLNSESIVDLEISDAKRMLHHVNTSKHYQIQKDRSWNKITKEIIQ